MGKDRIYCKVPQNPNNHDQNIGTSAAYRVLFIKLNGDKGTGQHSPGTNIIIDGIRKEGRKSQSYRTR